MTKTVHGEVTVGGDSHVQATVDEGGGAVLVLIDGRAVVTIDGESGENDQVQREVKEDVTKYIDSDNIAQVPVPVTVDEGGGAVQVIVPVDDSGGAAPVLSDDGGDVRVPNQEGRGDNDIAVHVQIPVDNSGGDGPGHSDEGGGMAETTDGGDNDRVHVPVDDTGNVHVQAHIDEGGGFDHATDDEEIDMTKVV